MSKLGIVLAAGESTRLPGKVLLPTRKGPVVQSAIDLCRRSGCLNTITVISRKEWDDEGVLFNYLNSGVERMCPQDAARGVIDAIRCATRDIVWPDEYLVTFGDNVYDERETADALDCASVRRVEAPNADQLDGWEEWPLKGAWADRGRLPQLKFAGWLHLSREKLERLVAASDFLIPAMNAARVRPHVVERMQWWDIGLPEAYSHYWRTSK